MENLILNFAAEAFMVQLIPEKFNFNHYICNILAIHETVYFFCYFFNIFIGI